MEKSNLQENVEIFLADYGKSDLSEIIAQIFLGDKGYICRVCGDSFGNAAYKILKYPDETHKKPIEAPYVKAEISTVLDDIIKLLDSGEKVIVECQPCDAAALADFLKNDYDSLLVVDSICKGGVSEKVYKKYINDSLGGKTITALSMENGIISAEFDDGTDYLCQAESNPYLKAYSEKIIYKKSCYSCKFSRMERFSDFTVGISEKSAGKYIIISDSEKSKKYLKKLLKKSLEYREITPSEAIQENKFIDNPIRHKIPDERHRFFEEFDEKTFSRLVNDVLCKKYDVGIAGIWFGLNYGSVLTYYALYRVIRNLGYTAALLAKPKYMWNDRYSSRDSVAGKFIYNHCNVGEIINTPEEMYSLNNNYDMFIAGSDVIWNYQICGMETGEYFFLNFAADTKKKIVYSASFGSGLYCPENRLSNIRKSVEKLDYVSVREEAGAEICKEKFGITPECTIDPVFLWDKAEYESLAEESGLHITEPFITAYILGADKAKKDFILKAENLLETSAITIVNPNDARGAMEVLQMENMVNPSVEEWLYYIKNSKFVMCDSFYGVCFSIIFRKNFVAVINRNLDSKCRFQTLLKKCGLSDRLVYIEDGFEKKKHLFEKPVNYDEVYKKLEKYKLKSLKWLKDALSAQKFKNKPSEIAELSKEIENLEYRLSILEERLCR